MIVELNTWVRTFAWSPVKVIRAIEDGRISVDTVWAKPVYMKVVKNMRAPIPVIEYMTVADYKELWATLCGQTLLNLGIAENNEDAETSGRALADKNYKTDFDLFFTQTYGDTPAAVWDQKVQELIKIHTGFDLTVDDPKFKAIVSMTGGYGKAVPNGNMADFISSVLEDETNEKEASNEQA